MPTFAFSVDGLGAAEAAKERSRRDRNARRRFRRQNPGLWADLQARRPELRSPFQQQPAPDPEAEQQPFEQARTRKAASPSPSDRRVRLVTEGGKTIASTAAGNAERIAAALDPRHGPLTVVPA